MKKDFPGAFLEAQRGSNVEARDYPGKLVKSGQVVGEPEEFGEFTENVNDTRKRTREEVCRETAHLQETRVMS